MSHHLEFDRIPSALVGYARAAVSRGKGLREGESIPRIEASVRDVRIDTRQLDRYRKLCNYGGGEALPVPYPHILASSLHLQVLTHRAFPFKLLGAVHVRNDVTQTRAITVDDVLDVEVSVEGQTRVDAGYEFGLETHIRDAKGNVVWSSLSTNLIRQRFPGQQKKPSKPWTPPDFSAYELADRWTAPENIGRRYGLVAGDVNPIHMHALLAKPFGFKRAIAHGMWSFARAASVVLPADPDKATLTVAFKRPVLLPGKVELLTRKGRSKTDFLLTNARRDTVYLEGVVAAPKR
jgi:acyl dehydratase